jgi:putative transposase
MNNKAFKFRFYPNKEQKTQLAKSFGCARFVYNWGLLVRENAYNNLNSKLSIHDLIVMLTKLKRSDDLEFLKEVSSVILQQSLRNRGSAYDRFFKKQNDRPKFKKKSKKQSITLTKNAFQLQGKSLKLAKFKDPLKIKWSRELQGEVTSLTISKDCSDRYFVSFLCKLYIPAKLILNKNTGIDLGLTHFAIFSDGIKIDNPYFYKHLEYKLKKAQRKLSKKTKGSNNKVKARLTVAKIHAKIADARNDFLHKLSSKIIDENQVICIETLKVKNMLKNHRLAKSISDVSWSSFVNMLEYKADWYGRTIVKISQWFPSSKTCSICGLIKDKMPLNIRKWTCDCGAVHDRDINAAQNILRAGLAQYGT